MFVAKEHVKEDGVRYTELWPRFAGTPAGNAVVLPYVVSISFRE